MARTYAAVVGVVLLLLGVGGLLLGERYLLGLLNIEVAEDLIHVLSGALLAYVGLGQRDEGVARSVVGVVGIVYLLVGVLGFVVPTLFGLLPRGYTVADNLVHLALGILGIVIAYTSLGGTGSGAANSSRA